MDGSSSTGRGDDGESAMEEPDTAWVGRHLEVERLHDEHGGGVAVKVAALAHEGADADVDVAKTGAWLQAHGGEVKAFDASGSACCEHGEWCELVEHSTWMCWWCPLVCVCLRRVGVGFAPAQAGTRSASMHGVDKVGASLYVFVPVCIKRQGCRMLSSLPLAVLGCSFEHGTLAWPVLLW